MSVRLKTILTMTVAAVQACYFCRCGRQQPLGSGLYTSVIYSVSIYTSFIEIKLIEGFFNSLQLKRNRTSLESMKRQKLSARQFFLGFTIFILAFGLFFSAGKGYLTEELLAPGKIDSLSAASDTLDARTDLWIRALGGETLNLGENHLHVAGRLREYFLKMGLFGLIVAGLFWLAIKIGSSTTEKRMEQMNLRLKEIASGRVSTENKLVIVRADEIGTMVHHVNEFIDRQALLMNWVQSMKQLAAWERVLKAESEL